MVEETREERGKRLLSEFRDILAIARPLGISEEIRTLIRQYTPIKNDSMSEKRSYIKEQLKSIIGEIKGACNEAGIKPTDDMILDVSIRVYNSSNIERSRSRKAVFKPKQQDSAINQGRQRDFNLATEKQIEFLKSKNYQCDFDKLTKMEATELIKRFISK